jgi:hypothetical protein
MIDVLENHGDDPVVREITGFITGQNILLDGGAFPGTM